MVSALISRLVVLFVGTLYPAYGSYKAIRTKNAREYIHWIMYWICFALFTFIETFSDIFLAFLIPFYYELKILFLAWLLCPATNGSAILYKNFVHPRLVKHEQEIDEMIESARQNGVSAMYQLGTRGAQYASQLLATTALKGHEVILKQLQRSYSQGDVTDAAAILGPGEMEPLSTQRRTTSRNLNARKMVRSEPAFSDEDEDDFQIIEEDLTETAVMEVEEETPPSLPAKKKGTSGSQVNLRKKRAEAEARMRDVVWTESDSSDLDGMDLNGSRNRQFEDSDTEWKPLTRSRVQRKAAVVKKSPTSGNRANDNNNIVNRKAR